MRGIPGSHRHGILSHGTADRAGNLLSINQEIPRELVGEDLAVDLCLRAGQMSLHHGLLVHGSNVNRSRRRRCGLTVRYVPTHVRQSAPNSLGKWWKAVLVRAADRFAHFRPPPPPAAGLTPRLPSLRRAG